MESNYYLSNWCFWLHFVLRPAADAVPSQHGVTLNITLFYSAHWTRTSPFTKFLDHTQRRTIVGRTPLDEWSARRKDLYLTTHNTHKRETCLPAGFEPAIPTGERPQTHALDRAVTGTGLLHVYLLLIPRFVASSFLSSIPSVSKRLCTRYPPVLSCLLSFTYCVLPALCPLHVTPT